MRSTSKADFTFFPSAENKDLFGDYFSKSKWLKSNTVYGVVTILYLPEFPAFDCEGCAPPEETASAKI